MKAVLKCWLLAVLVMAGVLAGCAPARPAPDAITVQLSWFHTV